MGSIYINNINGMNKTISNLGSQITVNFNPPILLDPSKKYQMALNNGSIVYCHPNVTNRYLRFTYKNLSYNLQLENGIYDTNALNIAFQNLTSYLYPTNGLFSIEPLTSTSQVCIFFYDYVNTELSFQSDNNDNIMDLLGFTPSDTTNFTPLSITNFALSQGKAMLNNISQFLISADCITSTYNNSQSSNLLYTSTIEVSPYSTQNLMPYNMVWSDIYKNIINSMTITLTGDDGSTIDMTGNSGISSPELFAITIEIREKGNSK